jgi:hypothetical protein
MVLASPFSTGGGGETFEKLAGACALVALLAREEIPGLDLPVTKVRFQQRYAVTCSTTSSSTGPAVECAARWRSGCAIARG